MALDDLVGGTWAQDANAAGQVYYTHIATGETQFDIPTGFEDRNQDTWTYDAACQRWTNTRTGRIVFQDPRPASPQTYLSDRLVSACLQAEGRNPTSLAGRRRTVTTAILRRLFTEADGFELVEGDTIRGNSRRYGFLKVECRPGGSSDTYDFMLIKCKGAGYAWESAVRNCLHHCDDTRNESGEVYDMVQVGLEVRFYSYRDRDLTPLSNVLHLQQDVHEVTRWAEHLKANPLPFNSR